MKPWIILVKGGIAAALVFYLWSQGIVSAQPFQRLADWPLAGFLTVFLVFLTLPVGAWRWGVLLRSQGIILPWRDVYHINALGNFSAMFLPGAAGGDALRILLAARQSGKGRRMAATVSVAIDRATGLLGLVGVGLAALLYRIGARGDQGGLSAFLPYLLGGIVLAALAGGMGLWLCRRLAAWPGLTRLGEIVSKLVTALAGYADAPQALAGVVLLAALTHILTIAGLVSLAVTIGGGPLDGADYSVAAAVGLLANVIPLTPGGLGIGEGAFAQICGMLDPGQMAGYGSIFLAYRALTSVAVLPGLLSWFLYAPHLPAAASVKEAA